MSAFDDAAQLLRELRATAQVLTSAMPQAPHEQLVGLLHRVVTDTQSAAAEGERARRDAAIFLHTVDTNISHISNQSKDERSSTVQLLRTQRDDAARLLSRLGLTDESTSSRPQH